MLKPATFTIPGLSKCPFPLNKRVSQCGPAGGQGDNRGFDADWDLLDALQFLKRKQQGQRQKTRVTVRPWRLNTRKEAKDRLSCDKASLIHLRVCGRLMALTVIS